MTLKNAAVELLFQSTLPMRGATEAANHHLGKREISIHAPHAGSDKSKMT